MISVFVDRLIKGESPLIYGDGEQSRDFINVLDVVEANLCALTKPKIDGEVFNVCTGEESSINTVFQMVQKATNKARVEPVYVKSRVGNVLHSYGDNFKALKKLGFRSAVGLEQGLNELVDWKMVQ